MRRLARSSPGISYERLDKGKGVFNGRVQTKTTWYTISHKDEMDSGIPVTLPPGDHIPPAEETDSEYPIILTTGRRRSTYHTGTQTGRARASGPLVPSEMAEINPDDADQLELSEVK
ncbi:MAG: hypothetical protein Ct9H300mP19_11250 [Dehalococcoidia bacterium]|nr:MAG: hypothetical protein Ct9H300mP19_11250 [Dehalococcoidia bacterium]